MGGIGPTRLASNSAAASEEVTTCQDWAVTPKLASRCTYCSGVSVPLLVAKATFSPRSRMRAKIAGRSPIGLESFHRTPSMSRMRDLMFGESII